MNNTKKIYDECVDIFHERKTKIANSDLTEAQKSAKVNEAWIELKFIRQVALLLCKSKAG